MYELTFMYLICGKVFCNTKLYKDYVRILRIRRTIDILIYIRASNYFNYTLWSQKGII